MGQCSTLPNEQSQNAGDSDQLSHIDKSKRNTSSTATFHHARQQRDDGSSFLRMKSNEDDTLTTEEKSSADSKTPLMTKKADDTDNFFRNLVHNKKQTHPQHESQRRMSSKDKVTTPDRRSQQQEFTPPPPVAQPPDSAKRIRCYRLNLENNDNNNVHHQLGPIEARNRLLQMSISEDSSAVGGGSKSGHSMAVSTAQIFRGLTIARDGTIQSKKLGRSSKNVTAGKADEKSRQAAKIDKAKDLVEESANGKLGDKDEDTKMVSLVIMGEYDDMKHLVRDGSKRLKDSEGLPDEALLSLNRRRHSSAPEIRTNISSRGDNRKRSPHPSTYSPVKVKLKSPTNASTRGAASFASSNGSNLPRLKENPRDTRPRSHSHSGKKTPYRFRENCNNLPIFGGSESDWSDTLALNFNSIWTCGARKGDSGTISPTSMPGNSPQHHPPPHHQNHHHRSGRPAYFPPDSVTERRDESSYDQRIDVTNRAWDK